MAEAKKSDSETHSVDDPVAEATIVLNEKDFAAFRDFVNAPKKPKPNLAKLLRNTKPKPQ